MLSEDSLASLARVVTSCRGPVRSMRLPYVPSEARSAWSVAHEDPQRHSILGWMWIEAVWVSCLAVKHTPIEFVVWVGERI